MDLLELHPITLRLFKQGHPWILKDEYTVRFPKGKDLLQIKEKNTGEELGWFLHDPQHPRIKARFLTKEMKNFESYLKVSLKKAIEKRKQDYERENLYLSFGEVDGLPGLLIQKLKNHLLIQYQAFVWEKYLPLIKRELKNDNIWIQKRIPGEQKQAPEGPQDSEAVFKLSEYGVDYKIVLNQYHDIGIYTDMAGIRKKLDPHFKKARKVLNLFSYTGAFSLQALKHGAEATSVDLSGKYMSWLEENIEMNGWDDRHTSIVKSCAKALKENKNIYDFIICDPPSFSSDGKKRESAQDFYKKNWNEMWRLLEPGGKLIVFLNTHKVTRKKFKTLIQSLIKGGKVISELYLSEDCSSLKGFPESDYLKGFIIQK